MKVLIKMASAIVLLCALCGAGGPTAIEQLPDYEVSWLGNTFPGGNAGWVPQDIDDAFVTPDGTVFTNVYWEEQRGNLASFKDGEFLQQSSHWKNGGMDRKAGKSICATDRYVFFATTPGGDRPPMSVLGRRDRDRLDSKRHEKRQYDKVTIHGVAADNERVYAACEDGMVRVYTHGLERRGKWSASDPGEMAIDGAGRLWIIDREAGQVRAYTTSGDDLKMTLPLPSRTKPSDVAADGDDGLLVADNGPNRQVHRFTLTGGVPRHVESIGQKGGVFVGPVPGKWGPKRFIAPIGVGRDAQGRLFVVDGRYAATKGGTAVIRVFTPNGELDWQAMSTEYIDVVDVDARSDGTRAFGARHRYTLDLSRPAGKQWRVEAMTVDPERYPNDRRVLTPRNAGVWHRWIDGRELLYITEMTGDQVSVFRFDRAGAGETAIPCAEVKRDAIWVDADANGKRDAGETTKQKPITSRGWWVDAKGTIWQATEKGGVYAFPMQGLSDAGVPMYTHKSRRVESMPKPFYKLRRIRYDDARDEMILGGGIGPKDGPKHWKPMGPHLARYKNWSGERELVWHVKLPQGKTHGHHASREPFDFAAAGDYVFVVYVGDFPELELPHGTVVVLERDTGRIVGCMHPTGPRDGAVPMGGLQDLVRSISAKRLSDGSYLVFIEDDGYTKNVMYRWRPRKGS